MKIAWTSRHGLGKTCGFQVGVQSEPVNLLLGGVYMFFFHDGFMVLSGFIKLPGTMIIPSNGTV